VKLTDARDRFAHAEAPPPVEPTTLALRGAQFDEICAAVRARRMTFADVERLHSPDVRRAVEALVGPSKR